MDLWAFATSAHGLSIEERRFWSLSYREYKALEGVWHQSQREGRFQWASVMAAMYNAWLRGENRQAYSPFDWLPKEDRPAEKKPWEVDYEAQKLSIRAMLSFAAEFNRAKEGKPN